MEPMALTQLECLKNMIHALVEACADDDLLDFICKLLAREPAASSEE